MGIGSVASIFFTGESEFMIKINRLIINFVMAVFLLSNTHALASFTGGDGTSGDPYQIADANQLQEMKDHLSSCFVLINDIDASATVSWNSGAGFEPIGDYPARFDGSFDGQGHKITGLYICRTEENDIGLFGFAGFNAKIMDVSVCADITGNNYEGLISNCHSTGEVKGNNQVGGLVGINANTVTCCYSTGSTVGEVAVGGLVGYNSLDFTLPYQGGITDCYSTGNAFGDNQVGGLVGYNNDKVINCYSTGNVDGDQDVGGLVGFADYYIVSDSFWDIETSGQATSVGGTGKTTAEMRQQATFVGWNFTDIWAIAEGKSCPFFQWDAPSFFSNLIDWNGNLVADFGDHGLWYYDGSAWNWMTNTGHVNRMAVWDGKLVVDFGVGKGLYFYDGSWQWMTNRSLPSNMVTWNNGSAGGGFRGRPPDVYL